MISFVKTARMAPTSGGLLRPKDVQYFEEEQQFRLVLSGFGERLLADIVYESLDLGDNL